MPDLTTTLPQAKALALFDAIKDYPHGIELSDPPTAQEIRAVVLQWLSRMAKSEIDMHKARIAVENAEKETLEFT